MIWEVFEISVFPINFNCMIFLKLKICRFLSIRGVATSNKNYFGNIGYKMLLATNPGSQNIFWSNPCALARAFPAPKCGTFWKHGFQSKMGKISVIFWHSGRNSLQTCATTLKSSFRALLSFVAGITKANRGATLETLIFLDKFVQKSFKNWSEAENNICCRNRQLLLFFSNTDIKVSRQKFLALGPPGGRKNSTFSKKSRFFWPEWIFSIIRGRRAWQKFLPDPQFFDFYHFSAFL